MSGSSLYLGRIFISHASARCDPADVDFPYVQMTFISHGSTRCPLRKGITVDELAAFISHASARCDLTHELGHILMQLSFLTHARDVTYYTNAKDNYYTLSFLTETRDFTR